MRETVKLYICELGSADWRSLALQERIASRYREKILTAKLHEIATQEAAAGLMLLRCLGVDDESELIINEYGKPDLPSGGHFSLSHCEDFAVLAAAKLPVGVDIERIGRATVRTVRRVLPNAAGLETADDTELTRLWTRAEAVLKAEGTGFHKDPRDDPELMSAWHVESFEYKGHVVSCALGAEFDIKTEEF